MLSLNHPTVIRELDLCQGGAFPAEYLGQLFARSSRTRDRSWSTSKAQGGRLIRLLGDTIDALVEAREQDLDPCDCLDEAIGWDERWPR